MDHPVSRRPPPSSPSLSYQLGRAVGPRLARARWLWSSMTGPLGERLAAEEALGKHLRHAYLETRERDDDPGIRRMLNRITETLCSGMGKRCREFRVESIVEATTNALALPGGFIFVTRPLIELCDQDESEIAFVIAHEIGHIVRSHAFDRYVSVVAGRAMTHALPLKSRLSPAIRNEVAKWIERAYSRDQEFEADLYAARLMKAANMDWRTGMGVLRRLERKTDSDSTPTFLSTHPPIADRIAALDRR